MIGSFDRRMLDIALRQDLGVFVAKVFHSFAPGDKYLHNWHIDALVYELMLVRSGRTRRLIINQPPRSLKSICASVAFVAWCVGHNPSMRFACVSYSNELAASLARQFRAVVASPWYRCVFPNYEIVKDTEAECVTSQSGGRFRRSRSAAHSRAAVPTSLSLTTP